MLFTLWAPHDALIAHLLTVCEPVRHNAFARQKAVSAAIGEDGIRVLPEVVEDGVQVSLRGVLLHVVPRVQEPLGDCDFGGTYDYECLVFAFAFFPFAFTFALVTFINGF